MAIPPLPGWEASQQGKQDLGHIHERSNTMPNQILVGIDGSPHGEAAIGLAIRWAGEYGCRLTGLGIIDEPGMTRGEPVPIGGGAYKADLDRSRVKKSTRLVEDWLGRFSDRCNAANASATAVTETGDPLTVLSLEAQRHDLVLLGRQTHFRYGYEDSPDDVLTQLVRQAPRPVVAVPLEHVNGHSVVIADDSSLQAARAVQAFQATGLGTRRPVFVVTVGTVSSNANRTLDFLAAHDILATPKSVPVGASVAAALAAAAREVGAGLIVMGAYGRSTLHEFFLGSVTRTMLAESPVPLFLYH